MKLSVRINWIVASLFISLHVSPAHADLIAKFEEGAPKDRFTIMNNGSCTLSNATVRLDLSGSKAGLIFDITGKGAGVEVFQPLEIVAGANALSEQPSVRDGDNKVELSVERLVPNQSIAFTVDVDDTAGGREITVSDTEIQGAVLQLAKKTEVLTARFESGPEATLSLPKC